MGYFEEKDRLSLSVASLKIVDKLLHENRELSILIKTSESYEEMMKKAKKWISSLIKNNDNVRRFLRNENLDKRSFDKLEWKDYAVLRLHDYHNNEGKYFQDLNHKIGKSVSRPFYNIWQASKYGKGTANDAFFIDMLLLSRQLTGKLEHIKPSRKDVHKWMDFHSSGLDEDFVILREANKVRIIKTIIAKLDSGELKSKRFKFDEGLSEGAKFETVLKWWEDYRFHLRFAARSPEMVNDYLDNSLREDTLKTLQEAFEAGIPIFINPYYLSLISVDITPDKTAADKSLRDYIFHSHELVEEFGKIVAWEKEDIVEPGKPNAAGWMLPAYNNVHRRYPEVAIFIPDTVGRACAGLCVSCQRMYDFQSGHFNFNLEKLKPKTTWTDKMEMLLEYFEKDTQLRDILITGGDSFMSSTRSMKQILDATLQMVNRKREANLSRPEGEKYAEIQRIRLGTRLPAYLPQRITSEFVAILKKFKTKGIKLGIKQFVIQTHIQSAMEVTPDLKRAIKMLLSAGWLVTNQVVFTSASSRRGHTAKLRKVLNEIGVVPYYTFSVKGFMENYQNFATNARSVQEMQEEKIYGEIPDNCLSTIIKLPEEPEKSKFRMKEMKKANNLLFLATDRSVMNLPGVGKSMTFRVIGITNDGRRILEFEYDHNRNHSPTVNITGKVDIVESKSILNYLEQMEAMGERKSAYRSIWGYSVNVTEEVMPLFKYPEFDFKITDRYTNVDSKEYQVVK